MLCLSAVKQIKGIAYMVEYKTELLKIYCNFNQGKKKKRTQFSIVFAFFMFKKGLLCSFCNV